MTYSTALYNPVRSWFLRSMVLPVGDIVFGQRMMQRLRFLEEAQWWEPERLETKRDELVTEVVKTAYEQVPFYAKLMKDARFKPSDIRRTSDLQKLPYLTKDRLRSGYPDLVTRSTGQRTYEKRTSGSTGKNFVVLEDSETAGWYRASLMLAFEWSGWQIGERQLQTGMTFQRGIQKRLKDALLGCHYISAAALDNSSLDRSLRLMESRSIRYIWGYPGSLYFLAQRAAETGWNRPLRSAVTWGDNLYIGYRKVIERAFQTRVYDTYGCAEGIEVAAQCGTGSNYHIHALDTIVEYVDQFGEPVSHREPGSILLTRLHAGPMPLIRYKVGDVGTAGDQTPCPCGRGFPIMRSIEGRDTDVVITPSGNRLIVHYFTGVLEHFSEVDSFQIRQDEPYSITLLVVPTKEFTKETPDRIVSALQQPRARDLKINVEVVPSIPVTTSGKRRFIISTLPTGDCVDSADKADRTGRLGQSR